MSGELEDLGSLDDFGAHEALPLRRWGRRDEGTQFGETHVTKASPFEPNFQISPSPPEPRFDLRSVSLFQEVPGVERIH